MTLSRLVVRFKFYFDLSVYVSCKAMDRWYRRYFSSLFRYDFGYVLHSGLRKHHEIVDIVRMISSIPSPSVLSVDFMCIIKLFSNISCKFVMLFDRRASEIRAHDVSC
jgi:hypothetical protein